LPPPYFVGNINISFSLSSIFGEFAPPQRGLYLAITLTRGQEKVTELIASLTLGSPLSTVAGSEWIPNYSVARPRRHETNQIQAILRNIHLARAFTCYQLLDPLAALADEIYQAEIAESAVSQPNPF